MSPTTVYASAACTPASTSPVLSPTRSPSRRPPPSSSATSRRTSCCMLHGRAHRAFGVVLVRGRGAEDGHDPVAGELVDVAADLDHDPRQRRQHPVGDLADALRVEVLGPGGEVGQVAEQHGDDPALGATRRPRSVGQRHAADVAEPCAGDRRGRAGGAAQRSGGRRRRAGRRRRSGSVIAISREARSRADEAGLGHAGGHLVGRGGGEVELIGERRGLLDR